jgi:hypothetical protein
MDTAHVSEWFNYCLHTYTLGYVSTREKLVRTFKFLIWNYGIDVQPRRERNENGIVITCLQKQLYAERKQNVEPKMKARRPHLEFWTTWKLQSLHFLQAKVPPPPVKNFVNTVHIIVSSNSKSVEQNSLSWEANTLSAGQKFSAFVEPECSLPYSQKPATSLCPKPDESTLHRHIIFLKDSFEYYLIIYS